MRFFNTLEMATILVVLVTWSVGRTADTAAAARRPARDRHESPSVRLLRVVLSGVVQDCRLLSETAGAGARLPKMR
jgi:hypothetical protein